MPLPATIDVLRKDLFSTKEDLQASYPDNVVEKVLRIRDMYNWLLANPEAKDKQFIEEVQSRYQIGRTIAYSELALIKVLIPNINKNTRDFHRWRYNEMILETYRMAKLRKDTKTMEKAASSYAKYNRVDLEDEMAVPYELIVVQPFVATNDPSVLGIKPIPNIKDKIKAMIEKYSKETIDIEDVEYEEADLEEAELFGEDDKPQKTEDDFHLEYEV